MMAEGGRGAIRDDRQIGDGGISNTVEVRGFSANINKELLEMYFENSRRSGGGDTEEVQIGDGVAYITFMEAEVAQRVVSRSNHQVDGQSLTVALFHPSPPKPCYENRVLIQGLTNAITEEMLTNFLETVTEAKVREFLYGEEEGKVVVTLSDNIDIAQLRKIIRERSIDNAFLQVAKVDISSCIIVQNLQPSTSHDVVLFYFENKRRSGGGDVERVEMKTEEGYCLVYFEDPSVIDRVLSKSHKVDGADVEVHLHHECLGQRSSRKKSDPYLRISSPGPTDSAILEEENIDNKAKDKTSSSVSSNPEKESDFVEVPEWQENDGKNCTLPLWIKYKRTSDMMVMKCIKNVPCSWNFHVYWNFYTKTKQGQHILDEIVSKYNCSVAVCSDDEDLFIFEVTEKSFEQEPDVVHFIHDMLDNIYKCAKQFLYFDTLLVDQRMRGDVLQLMKQRKELDGARIELMGQQDNDAMCVICTEKDKMFVIHVVTEIIRYVKEDFENQEEIISVDHIWQKVMKHFGYIQKLGDKYPKVTIILDETKPTVMLKGARDQSKAAAHHLMELVGTVQSEVEEDIFSPGCQFDIFTYPEMCDYINNIIREISIVWIPNQMTKKIHLFSKKLDKIKGMDKLIKGCVHERLYPLQRVQPVSTPEMFSALEELKKKHVGKIVVNPSSTGLLVTTADDIFESVHAAVLEIISKQTELFPLAKEADDAKLAVQTLGQDQKNGAQEQSISSTGVSNLSTEEMSTVKNRIKQDLRILQQELLPIGEKITIYLSHIYNCGYFSVQKEDSCIDQITEELQKDCKTMSAPNMEQLKIGQFCAGLYSVDKCWTRAKIIDIKDSEPKMELLFVDYGDVDRVLSKDIRWLSEKTAAAPAQCLKCSLYGIQPLENEKQWSSASAAAFADIVKDAPLTAVTRTHYDETCEVDLSLVSDPVISISNRLIQQGVVRGLFPVESSPEENEVEEEEVDASVPESESCSTGVEILGRFAEGKKIEPMTELPGEGTERNKEQLFHKNRDSNDLHKDPARATCQEVDNKTEIVRHEQQPEGNKDEDNKKKVTTSEDDIQNGTNTKGKEQGPKKTKDEDKVTKAGDSGSVDNDAGADLESSEVDVTEESTSDDDDDASIMRFIVTILSENCYYDNIIAQEGEEALKWRFLFDCPYTQKELKENHELSGEKLVYKKRHVAVIHVKKPSRALGKQFNKLLQTRAEQIQIYHTVIPGAAVQKLFEVLNLVQLFKTKMVIAYQKNTDLYLCGKKEHMEEAIKCLNATKDYVLGLISKTENVPMKDTPLQLMKRWMEVHMLADTSDIHYEFKDNQNSLCITGLESEIVKAKDKLQNLLACVTQRRFTPEKCTYILIFQELGFAKYIEGILQDEKLVCTWDVNKTDCCIVVTAFDEEICEKACKMIDAACVTERIFLQVDATTRILLGGSWEQDFFSICTKLGGKMMIWLNKDLNTLDYVYTQDIRGLAKHEVQGLVSNWDREKHLSVEKDVIEQFVKEEQKLRKLENKYNVSISVSSMTEKMGFLIIGKDSNIKPALQELEKECNRILKPKSKPAMSWSSSEECELLCVPESSELELIMLKDKSLYRCDKSSQSELKDPETDVEIVEVIPVFSLNVSRPDKVKADMVLLGDKSKRPVMFSCPKWNGGESKEKPILNSVLCHLFEFLSNSSLGGEALLEIESTKIGSWPAVKFVRLLLYAFQAHAKAKSRTSDSATAVTRLFLLMKNEKVYDIVKATVADVFSVNTWAKSSDVAHSEEISQISSGIQAYGSNVKWTFMPLPSAWKSRTSSGLFHSRGSSDVQHVQIGESSPQGMVSTPDAIQVCVVKDQMTKRKEDVLVNSVHRSLNLSHGKVSQSILDVAGEALQKECQRKYPNGIEPGQVAITTAYKLRDSKFIFHGTFDMWNSQNEEALKRTLKEFVTGCLQRADQYKMKTIAFPAIGTGNLSYPHRVVAECMFEAVEKYSMTRHTNIEAVYFVIYYKDTETMIAFYDRMKIHKEKTTGSSVDPFPPPSHPPSSQGPKPKTNAAPLHPPVSEKNQLPMKGKSAESGRLETLPNNEDELTEEQCLENSEVFVSKELMEKIEKGSPDDIMKRYKVSIEYKTCSIKGELESQQKLEEHLRNHNGVYMEEAVSSVTDEEEDELVSLLHSQTVENISQVKYQIFKHFFNDMYVLFLQEDIELNFSVEERLLHVQGEDQEAVDKATENIRRAFDEINKFQESDLSIKKEQFDYAKQLLVEMNSSFPERKMYCYIHDDDPFTIHVTGRTWEEVKHVKHKMGIKLGTFVTTGRKKNSDSKPFDKNDNEGSASVTSESLQPGITTKSFKTAEGIKVFVYKGSILQAKVNVIVNAANEDLKHEVGIAKVIADAAGREFIEECQTYIKNNGFLSVGAACVTSGGRLKYPFVIHTVGPEWDKYSKTSEGLQKCVDDLWKTVIGCFFKAETLQAHSIALTAISSGKRSGVPMEICAFQYLNAVLKFSKSMKDIGSLKEIHFIDVNDAILDLITLAFSASLEDNQAASKQFDIKLGKVLSTFEQPSSQQSSVSKILKLIPMQKKPRGHKSEKVAPHYTMDKKKTKFNFSEILRVLIYVGDITESKCKAIVSIEDKTFKSQSGVAKANMAKAGHKFVACFANYRGHLRKVGDILEADAGNLKCEKVICCVVPMWKSRMSDEDYRMQLGQCFKNIMEKAKTFKSVAIPLIGTGLKDASIEICGKVLLESLLRFSGAHRDKQTIRKVHIINHNPESIACVRSIFMDYFEEQKKLDAESGQPAAAERKIPPPPKPGVTGDMASFNLGSNLPPGAQKMDRGRNDKQDNCVICMLPLKNPVKLKKCGHVFCKGCVDTQLQHKPVCPTCNTIYGVITGNQPAGRMTEYINKRYCLEGYEECGIIEITYDIPDGFQSDVHPNPGKPYKGLKIKAYLPNNDKGQKVLKLLHLAFDRRLIFTIGQSKPSGRDYMVTWNGIHHKTSPTDGRQRYGYPDPTYLDRVLEDLAAKGVTEDSISMDQGTSSAYERVVSQSIV